jgi:methylphosphotriester-DNA--protein-cysteine methyltransferase
MGIKCARLALVALAVGTLGYLLARPRRRREGALLPAFVGNETTRVFHDPSCRYARGGHATKGFATRHEAIDHGYEPCRVCSP